MRNFRPKRRKQASSTEVSRCTGSKTSVPNGENEAMGRKSAGEQCAKLPSQTAKTGLRYGSQQENKEQNFRPKWRKQAFGTEVSRRTRSKTSVLNGENGQLGRKSAGAQGAKLPSQTAKTGLRDGSRRAKKPKNDSEKTKEIIDIPIVCK